MKARGGSAGTPRPASGQFPRTCLFREGALGEAAGEGVGGDPPGVEREVAAGDPAQEGRVLRGEGAQGLALLLAEVHGRLAVHPAEAALAVDVERVARVDFAVEGVRVGREVGVAGELALEDAERGGGVRRGAVRAHELLAAVEAHRGGEVARLAAVVDAEGVDEPAAAGVEEHAAAGELLLEDRDVELREAEAAEVAVAEEGEDLRRLLLEARRAAHHRVGDAVDGGRLGGDRDAGIEQPGLLRPPAAGFEPDDGELKDPVGPRVEARGLDVEDRERPVEREESHGG